MSEGVHWSNNSITYSINQNINFSSADIQHGLSMWESVCDVDFVQTASGAQSQIVFVDLAELKSAFNLTANYAGLAIVITDDIGDTTTGRIAYVGLDTDRIPSFDPARVAAHEVGHALGFTDDPSADPLETIYSYVGSHDVRLGSRDIEFVQEAFGASSRDDAILHGEGSGRVSGGIGDDTISGEGGDDVIYGNVGEDALSGGVGADTVLGGQDSDALHGGAGDDVLYGNRGEDVLSGDDGNDRLFGGQGDDVLSGGLGDDILMGNAGDDVLHGGAGADLFIIDGADTLSDFNPDEGDRLSGNWDSVQLVGLNPDVAEQWWV